MKPIPVVFHIGPLQIHTYGIGLAITFWFGYRYFAKRLRDHGYPDAWLGKAFVWIIVASIVGARAAHVVSMWSFYTKRPGEILAIWNGGLSSYGGLALGVPVGLICARRWCRELRLTVALDLVAPVLVIAWAVGRLLGPQLMVAGGGPRTTAWYGMAYAGQAGKRVPVPIWQAFECFLIWVVALAVERFVAKRGGPIGLVVTIVVTLYGLSRFFDEYLWLSHGTAGDLAVEVTSLVYVAIGLAFAGWLVWRDRHKLRARLDLHRSGEATIGDPWRSPLAGAVPAAAAGAVPAVAGEAAVDGAPDTAPAVGRRPARRRPSPSPTPTPTSAGQRRQPGRSRPLRQRRLPESARFGPIRLGVCRSLLLGSTNDRWRRQELTLTSALWASGRLRLTPAVSPSPIGGTRETREGLEGVALVQEVVLPRAPVPFSPGPNGVWKLRFERPPVRRFEYRFELSFTDGHHETVLDPANPLRGPGAFGERSVIEFPDYRPPPFVGSHSPRGEVLELALPSLLLGDDQPAILWSARGPTRRCRCLSSWCSMESSSSPSRGCCRCSTAPLPRGSCR